jgi:hypothetical protein
VKPAGELAFVMVERVSLRGGGEDCYGAACERNGGAGCVFSEIDEEIFGQRFGTSQRSRGSAMTRRFFYTDPLAAAWMAKHFKMDFRIDDPDGKVFLETLLHGLREWRDATAASMGYKFHIHPDSLPLLEPQLGDVVESQQVDGVYDVVVSDDIYCGRGDRNTNLKDVKKHGDKIVLRNGIPFMWPENE